MVELSQFCQYVMGKPPCEYSIVGMGSLAREEITPYSDFEHIILLCDDENYKSYLDYFKWFSVIFHCIILNVQETIVPSLNVESFNDKDSSLGDWYYDTITPRGISFDGMMPHACKFPLGRQQHTKDKKFATELIKPVSGMLEYLKSEANLKNGYHLADILTKTCFVFGNEDPYKQFQKGAQFYRSTKSQTDIINDIKQQVKEDLNSFSTRFQLTKLKSRSTINIKQLVYRSSTIFVSALAMKHNISANSCFDIIDEMVKFNKITENTANTLNAAIVIACEIRLRVYMKKRAQCDNIIDMNETGSKTFFDIAGKASTINYFQIVYCLQCEVAKQLNFTKFHFYSDPQLINITIGLTFGIKNLTNVLKNLKEYSWNLSQFNFDKCIEQLEIKIHRESNSIEKFSSSLNQSKFNEKKIKSIAKYLKTVAIYDEAAEFYEQLLDMYQDKSENTNRDDDIAWANMKIGFCLYKSNQAELALNFHRRALDIKQNLALITDRDESVAESLYKFGRCHLKLHNHNHALTYLDRSLKLKQCTAFNADTDWDIALTLHAVGRCHLYLQNYEEALKNLNRALEIKQNTTLNVDADREVAKTVHAIGQCHINLHNNDEAFKNFNRALEIKQNASIDPDIDRDLASTLSNVGRCLATMQLCDDSWQCFKRSLQIFENTTLDEDKDIGIARTHEYIGESLMKKEQHAEALPHLRKAIEIYQIHANAEKDPRLGKTLNHMGLCLMKLQEHKNALRRLKQSNKIFEKFPMNEHIASTIKIIRSQINECSRKFAK